jgi:hypothetical protein
MFITCLMGVFSPLFEIAPLTAGRIKTVAIRRTTTTLVPFIQTIIAYLILITCQKISALKFFSRTDKINLPIQQGKWPS